jgi:magnesium-transporting ATPase (P-type)
LQEKIYWAELNLLNYQKEFLDIVEHVRVYARVNPRAKIKIIKATNKKSI